MEMLGESGKSMEKCRMFGWFWRICVWIWRIFWWWRMIKLDDFGGFLMVLDGWFLDMFAWILGLRLWLNMIKTWSQRFNVMRMISLCQFYRQRFMAPMAHFRRGQSTIATRALGSATSRLMFGSCTDKNLSQDVVMTRLCTTDIWWYMIYSSIKFHRSTEMQFQQFQQHPCRWSQLFWNAFDKCPCSHSEVLWSVVAGNFVPSSALAPVRP